ncbi:restriction endonuclease subunit S [Metamycoplasma hominis]|uniref:restriction endonuclease subunit S n=1 Tax=Metamycoplasma hominis TaxID=2098 RepID=UPI003CF366AB
MRGGVLSKNYLLLLNELWDKIVNIVEYKKLEEVTLKNSFKQVDAELLSSLNEFKGEVKLLPSSKNYDWFCSIKNINNFYLNYGEVITFGRARYSNIKYWNGYFLSSNNITIVSKDTSILLNKFLYYFLISNSQKFYVESSTYPKFENKIFDNFLIPLPPFEIQNKIVEILDKLETYTKDIQSGLPLEIDQRKKQYEYYRDKLLDFKDLAGGVLSKNYLLLLNELWNKIVNIVEYKKLGTIITKAPKSPFGVAKLLKMNKGDYLTITSGNKSFYVSDFLVDGEYIFVNDGGQADVKYNQGKTMYSDHVFAFKTNECNTKYLYFYLLNISNFINEKLFVGSGLKNLNKKEFLNLNIAIPPIEIQNKIVEILDKLQAYTKDIQTGLPLEIDQRKKQYEHYRDKLLNFKEKNTKI